MSFLFLPSDITLKALAGRIEEERNHAIELKPGVEEGELDEPPDRVQSEPGEAFEALSSDARPDEEILVRTQPGENLSLFGEPEPAPSAAYVAFTGGAAPAAAGAGELATAAGDPGSSYQRRERLREERSKLVSGARARRARRTARSTRASTARSACARSPTRRSSSSSRRTSCCGASWRAAGEPYAQVRRASAAAAGAAIVATEA